MSNLIIFPTAQDAVEKIAQDFLYLSQENRPVHISLSGGSTPKLLFQTLASPPFNQAIQWKNLHFWWGDERMVEADDPQSNYGEVQKLLFRHIAIPAENIHRIRGEAEHQAELVRFTQEIIHSVPNCQFDWIILGMGDDGHTASLFPHQTHFDDENLACLAQHPQSKQWRISKTAKLLRLAKRITFLVTGESKANILSEIMQNTPESQHYPASHIQAEKGVTEWYVDERAVSIWQAWQKADQRKR